MDATEAIITLPFDIDIELILIKVLFAFLMLIFILPVFAENSVDNYSIVVPVENQSESQRQIAFGVALHEFVDAHPVKQNSDLSKLFAHPELYVESFSYQPGLEQEDALNIIVHFDKEALSQFLPQHQATELQHVTIQISGVISTQALNKLMEYLHQIKAIKATVIEQVNGENVVLLVLLESNVATFVQTLMSDQHFVSLSSESSQSQSELRLKWIGE